jgi:hypothetical protein
MLQSFDFSGSKQIAARGRFFTYQASNASDIGADERIAVRVNGQPLGDFYVGDSIELPGESNRWEVEAYTPGLTGYVLVGDGRVTTNRAGVSGVMRAERGRVMAGRQYWGLATRTQLAALYATAGVMCNTGRLAINSATVHAKAAQICVVGITSGKPLANVVAGPFRNKRLSQAVSANCELAGGTCTTYPPTTPTDFVSFSQLGLLYLGGNDQRRLNFNDAGPLILEAGQGLFIASNSVNLDLTAEFDAEEF